MTDHRHDWGAWKYYDTHSALTVTCEKCHRPLVPSPAPDDWRDQIHVYQSRRDCTFPMNRRQAIQHVWGLDSSVRSEFCVSQEEEDAALAETREALVALGVTETEIDR